MIPEHLIFGVLGNGKHEFAFSRQATEEPAAGHLHVGGRGEVREEVIELRHEAPPLNAPDSRRQHYPYLCSADLVGGRLIDLLEQRLGIFVKIDKKCVLFAACRIFQRRGTVVKAQPVDFLGPWLLVEEDHSRSQAAIVVLEHSSNR